MADLDELAQRMRRDWNRRIEHDYRFWMSDGQSDDAAMWESGARDFDILFGNYQDLSDKVALDLGCGVGRMLRAATQHFGQVIGLDVSSSAIERARTYLGSSTKMQLIEGNGYDLQPLGDESIDVVYSFAALTSIPQEVIANYLLESNRVLKQHGVAKFQIYLGKDQGVAEQDTLHLRCFDERNVRLAFERCGFVVESIEELVLPFQVSFEELGILARIITVRKVDRTELSRDELAALLSPRREQRSQDWCGSELEYWMAIQYAQSLLQEGREAEARLAVEHAVAAVDNEELRFDQVYQGLLQELATKQSGATKIVELELGGQQEPQIGSADNAVLQRNLNTLRGRFPSQYQLLTVETQTSTAVEVRETEQGVVLYEDGQCLDHPSKPVSGAEAWVTRLFNEQRVADADTLVVIGVGAGYHIEAIQARGSTVSIVEPSVSVFWALLESRDITAILANAEHLFLGERFEARCFESGDAALAVRPQAQALYPELCRSVKSMLYSTRGFSSLHPSFAVLGPLQGGTLPTTVYTTDALSRLNQRVRQIDVSGFAPAYHLLNDLLSEEVRQKVMHGNLIEVISQAVVESAHEKPIDVLICMAQAPISGRALTELRKMGVITVLWFVEDYLRFTYWREIAQFFDFVFTIQRGACIEQIKAAGAGQVHYLPTACDPEIHRPVELSTEERERWGSLVSFVGAGYHNRQQMFANFANQPFKIWGTEWPLCRPFDSLVQEGGRRIAVDEYVKIFNATDINVNLHSSAEKNGVDPYGDFLNPRTFELAACGAFQLVDEREYLAECFTPGEEIVTFNGLQDLQNKIEYYSQRPDERIAIAARARERVLRDHTYEQRLRQLLDIVYTSKFERLRERQSSGPWARMIERAASVDDELHQRCKVAFERGEAANLDGLVWDIHHGKGDLTDTEKKLLFLHHIRSQIIQMRKEEVSNHKELL